MVLAGFFIIFVSKIEGGLRNGYLGNTLFCSYLRSGDKKGVTNGASVSESLGCLFSLIFLCFELVLILSVSSNNSLGIKLGSDYLTVLFFLKRSTTSSSDT